jgi:hypothetical protein
MICYVIVLLYGGRVFYYSKVGIQDFKVGQSAGTRVADERCMLLQIASLPYVVARPFEHNLVIS